MKYRYLLIFFVLLCLVYFFRLKSDLRVFYKEGMKAKITAPVANEPHQTGSIQIIKVGQFSVVTYRWPSYEIGQVLTVSGTLEKQVRDFGSDQFVLSYPSISIIHDRELGLAFRILAGLVKFRQALSSHFRQFLPEPQASLASGIVFGEQSTLPKDFYEALRRTGTMHIVVASGQNVTIVAGFLVVMLVVLVRRQIAVVLAMGGILAYAAMAGMNPPVVRAAIMGSLTYMAMALGRQQNGAVALGVASGLMLLIKPLLLFDVGFELSVGSTAGILWLYPRLSHWLERQVPQNSLMLMAGRELMVTVAAQLATLPIMVVQFGNVSLVAPAANMLVAPLVPVIMMGGGLVVGLGLVNSGLGQIAAWGVWVPLTVLVKIVEWFARMPGAMVTVEKLPWWWAVGYYFVLVSLLVKPRATCSR